MAPPEAAAPPPALFREALEQALEQLHAAHRSEVACLEETISRLTRQRGAAGGDLEADAQLGGPWLGNLAEADLVESDSVQHGCAISFSSESSLSEEGGETDLAGTSHAIERQCDASPPLRVCNSGGSATSSAGETSMQTWEEDEELQEESGDPIPAVALSDLPPLRPSTLSDSVDQHAGELGRGQCVWQWQRSKGGFRNYPPKQSARIEEAYRRGLSKVRLKSGSEGQTPMEIFFVDMIQLDPQSRNIRRVRRIGAKSWYIELARHVQAFVRSVNLGEPRWESFEKYKKRQKYMLGTGDEERTSALSSYFTTSSSRTSGGSYAQKADNFYARITESTAFFTVSMLVMLMNVIWIGVSVELGEFNQSLWDRHEVSILLEHGFMVYFSVEMMLQFISMKYKLLWFHNYWFCLDALCTGTMMLEVLVVPYTAITAGSTPALQVLRLTRLARLLKLFREIKDVEVIMRGMVSGMRSAALIWILIAVLLYTCSVLLTTATVDQSEVLRDKYFGSMGQTIVTLIAHGIAMDGVSMFFHDLRMHDGLFQGLVFTVFVFLTFFGLLNMLVGVFCNVAIEVADAEKDSSEIWYLHNHLEGIVECYMEDGKDHIDFDKFRLVMKNADVLQTLRTCGTDLDGLMMLSDILFPHEDSEISFPEFFSVIVRLRKGKPASVSEIIGLQEFTKQKMDKLEELIRQGMRINVEKSRSLSRSGSVLNFPRVRRRITHQDEEIRPEQRRDSILPRITARSATMKEAEKVRKNWIRS